MEKKDELDSVAEFHISFGHPIHNFPQIPTADRCHLRKKLLLEEVTEFVNAVNDKDLVEIADALCDILYVTYGAALEFGMGDILKQMFAEIHGSNMSKLGPDGKPITREDGKTIKGPNYSAPQLKTFLEL